jgi:hypothetical protein
MVTAASSGRPVRSRQSNYHNMRIVSGGWTFNLHDPNVHLMNEITSAGLRGKGVQRVSVWWFRNEPFPTETLCGV